MLVNEHLIIEKIQKWSKDDFIMIYEKYLKKIYEFIYFKVGNKQDAEDLTSQTFLKAFEKINTFDLDKWTKFSSWLYMIANNIVVDHFRANITSVDFDMMQYISDRKDVLSDVNDRHRIGQVLEFLETLDEEKKQIFTMRIWNKMSYEEISQVVWKSQDACKQTFSRTLSKIVEKFGVMALLLFINLIR